MSEMSDEDIVQNIPAQKNQEGADGNGDAEGAEPLTRNMDVVKDDTIVPISNKPRVGGFDRFKDDDKNKQGEKTAWTEKNVKDALTAKERADLIKKGKDDEKAKKDKKRAAYNARENRSGLHYLKEIAEATVGFHTANSDIWSTSVSECAGRLLDTNKELLSDEFKKLHNLKLGEFVESFVSLFNQKDMEIMRNSVNARCGPRWTDFIPVGMASQFLKYMKDRGDDKETMSVMTSQFHKMFEGTTHAAKKKRPAYTAELAAVLTNIFMTEMISDLSEYNSEVLFKGATKRFYHSCARDPGFFNNAIRTAEKQRKEKYDADVLKYETSAKNSSAVTVVDGDDEGEQSGKKEKKPPAIPNYVSGKVLAHKAKCGDIIDGLCDKDGRTTPLPGGSTSIPFSPDLAGSIVVGRVKEHAPAFLASYAKLLSEVATVSGRPHASVRPSSCMQANTKDAIHGDMLRVALPSRIAEDTQFCCTFLDALGVKMEFVPKPEPKTVRLEKAKNAKKEQVDAIEKSISSRKTDIGVMCSSDPKSALELLAYPEDIFNGSTWEMWALEDGYTPFEELLTDEDRQERNKLNSELRELVASCHEMETERTMLVAAHKLANFQYEKAVKDAANTPDADVDDEDMDVDYDDVCTTGDVYKNIQHHISAYMKERYRVLSYEEFLDAHEKMKNVRNFIRYALGTMSSQLKELDDIAQTISAEGSDAGILESFSSIVIADILAEFLNQCDRTHVSMHDVEPLDQEMLRQMDMLKLAIQIFEQSLSPHMETLGELKLKYAGTMFPASFDDASNSIKELKKLAQTAYGEDLYKTHDKDVTGILTADGGDPVGLETAVGDSVEGETKTDNSDRQRNAKRKGTDESEDNEAKAPKMGNDEGTGAEFDGIQTEKTC